MQSNYVFWMLNIKMSDPESSHDYSEDVNRRDKEILLIFIFFYKRTTIGNLRQKLVKKQSTVH